MRFFELLNESRSAPLFHGTPLCNLLHVLLDDCLTVNRQGFISLSRSYHVAQYFESYSDFPGYGGVLVLNQAKLAQRYRMTPVHDGANIDDEAFHDEDEERVFRPIRPLSHYLISININRDLIKHAATDTRYRDESDDYGEWFKGKRKLFNAGITALLRHPAVNRVTPRVVNTGNIATVGDHFRGRSGDDELDD